MLMARAHGEAYGWRLKMKVASDQASDGGHARLHLRDYHVTFVVLSRV